MSHADSRTARTGRIVLLLVSIWALLGYLLVPWVVDRALPAAVAERLDARLSIDDVHFDPFTLRLRLHGATLTGPLDAPDTATAEVLHWRLLDLDLSALSLLRLQPAIRIGIDAPRLRLERGSDGRLVAAALLPPTDPEAPNAGEAPEPPTSTSLPDLILSLHITDGSIQVIDRSRPETFETRFENLSLSVEDLQLAGGPAAPARFEAGLEGASLGLDGEVETSPAIRARIGIRQLPLKLADRWLADTTPLRQLAGTLDLEFELALEPDGNLLLEAGRLELTQVSAGSTAPVTADLQLQRLTAAGIRGSLMPPELTIGRLELAAPRLEADWEGELRPLPTGAPGPVDETPPIDPAGDEAEPPRMILESASIAELELALTDRTLPEPARLGVSGGTLRLGRIAFGAAPEAAEPTALELDLQGPGGGRIRFDGRVRTLPSLEGRLELSSLELTTLAPWIDAWSRLGLGDGRLDAGLELEVEDGARVRGELDLHGLRLADPDGVRLIDWERLALRGLDVSTPERSLRLETLELEAPRMRFARLADGSTNLTGIGPRPGMGETPRTAADDVAAAAAPAADPGKDDATADGWNGSAGRFALRGGTLDFTDETLVIPFSTTIEALEGEALELSTSTEGRARLSLDGRIPPNGSATIEARTHLAEPLAETDIDVRMEQVPMPPLSAYVGTFAGYRIAGGRLDLDLGYRIRDTALEADNRLVAHALQLGPRIESPDALDLPLELALALLRDSDDRIVLEVPVSGDLADPQFDLTPAITRAIGNVLRNLATAPFKLLAGLVGGDDTPIDRVEFEYGTVAIPEDQQPRFIKLETALNQRPALQLVIAPTHAGAADRNALRRARLQQQLAALQEEEATSGDAEDEEALRALYAQRFGEDQLEALVDQYRLSRREDADTERVRTLPAELRSRLLADIEIGDEALTELARARADSVREQLEAAGLVAGRIRIEDEVRIAEGRDSRLAMSFDLAPAR
jgi:hypothetical protein